MKKIISAFMAAILVFALTACGVPANTGGNASASNTQQNKVNNMEISGSVSLAAFEKIRNIEKLSDAFKSGRIPSECRLLYDAMGSLPEVSVTDTDEIRKIYTMLSDIIVVGKSEMSITDSYHHVYFILEDETVVRFDFEGTGLISIGDMENYEISGGEELWSYIRQLQDKQTSSQHSY